MATSAQSGAAPGHCCLCGSGMDGAVAGSCPACASTARQRVMRRSFQALPAGLLAWRRAALPPGRHGVDARWFAAAAASAGHDDATVDFTIVMLPARAGAGDAVPIGVALERLSARGVAYVEREVEHHADAGAGATAAELLRAMTALLAAQYLACTVIAIDGHDPGSDLRLPGWLLLRDDADAALWQHHLRAWHGAAALAAVRVEGAFAPLRAELACWQDAQSDCSFWWRDDDLIEDGAALRRLAALSRRFHAPVLMAVIPAQADAALARCAADADLATLAFCQHGWNHVNHEAPGQPNSEFGAGRDPQAALADLARGNARMRALFGAHLLPIMVPPWNTLTAPLAAQLPALGLVGLSQYVFQPSAGDVDGLVRVDTHLDIVDWSADAGVREPAVLIERLVDILKLRRGGQLSGPLGILSHHRVMAEGSWRFLEQLHALTAQFSCVRWLHPRQAFFGDDGMPHSPHATDTSDAGAPCAV